MCENINSNPFAGLFATDNEVTSFTSQIEVSRNTAIEDVNLENNYIIEVQKENQCLEVILNSNESKIIEPLGELIAEVFGITFNYKYNTIPTQPLVFINADSIEHAIFERLLLKDPNSFLISKNDTVEQDVDHHFVQTEIVFFLFESYCRLQKYRICNGFYDIVDNLQIIIIRNICTALQEPEIFIDQKVYVQFITLFKEGNVCSELLSFINNIIKYMNLENKGSETEILNASFTPILNIIHEEVNSSSLLLFKQYWFSILQTFATIEPLAKLIITHSSIKNGDGNAYADTLLGSMLNLSCLPKTANEHNFFFDKPFQQQNSAVDLNIWVALNVLNESLFTIFHTLLKCSQEIRHLTLLWICNCLHANENRGQLWNSHNEISDDKSVSDGFMLNLGNVLLKLCQPFCSKANDIKILKIDPTYCAARGNKNECYEKGLHMTGLSSKTCLLPTPEGVNRLVANSFNFVTECFYLTHLSLDIGYRIILEKLFKASQDLARLYNDVGLSSTAEVNEFITERMENQMTKYLSMRASLLTPEILNLLAKFHAATAFWLIQVNIDANNHELNQDTYAPCEYKDITFPLPEKVPETLRCIPEFIIENTVSFLCFLRRWCPNVFEEQGPNFLNPILTEIITLMESPTRLYNPHLRARLAEGLEALLPNNDNINNPNSIATLGIFQRQQLFLTHPHKHIIVQNLLNVFVSIEMTGQSVQFEQKFNYRRPMYIVMAYLWKIPTHKNNFKQLAEEALANMEATQPPLFLRFVNLLTNDAVFLLDDALSNIIQLRQMMNARDSGEWAKLSQQEREQQYYYLEHIGTIARFDNILGRETIQTLKILTSEIKSVFCHSTMVDRIASMLNYLLLQLVGPNKKNLKIKHQKEYDFNPAHLVLNICQIYINLSENENFILAVSQDGRSYSSELFKLANEVLVRIGGVGILNDLDIFARKVHLTAIQKKEEEEILLDAPEEFLDPIMSTLMKDPVVLPSSKAIIDRQTIARHLLSDQTDPFNRSPLTMDMVTTEGNLKMRIDKWIERKRKEREASYLNE